MKSKHLFITDPITKLNLELDTSVRLAYALHLKNQIVAVCSPTDLSWKSGQRFPSALAQVVEFDSSSLTYSISGTHQITLDKFQSIHMRKDPPFDADYIATTWFLDHLPSSTRVYNAPQALRSFNEKFSLLHYPNIALPSLVSGSSSQIFNFIENESQGDAILKPLHLFGGRGVERLVLKTLGRKRCVEKIDNILKSSSPILAQPFNPLIFTGEIRSFTAFGHLSYWCRKIPKNGEFLANTRSGATLETYVPSQNEFKKIMNLSQELANQGIHFVGYDIIGEKVTEINITSPRLLAPGKIPEEPFHQIAEHLLKVLPE